MKSILPLAAIPLTNGESNHFFGFHDLCPFDASDRHLLALRVGFADRPPGPKDWAEVVVVDALTKRSTVLGQTTAWNFPQGGRQQWWPGRAQVAVFNYWEGDRLWAIALDLSGQEVARIEKGVYAFSPQGDKVYSLNFGRLHQLGGYGFALPELDRKLHPCPDDDGIHEYEPATGRGRLLVSIRQVAQMLGLTIKDAQAQYLTHPVPSPSGEKLCFLHRYWLPDGGLNTSVGVCDRDGSNLRIFASGFYSHFDWANDNEILIWGQTNDRTMRLRRSQNLLMRAMLRVARPCCRIIKSKVRLGSGPNKSYQLIDVRTGGATLFLPQDLPEDGHPSYLSGDRKWLVTDTYPDREGYRNLMLVHTAGRTVHDLGRLGTPTLKKREVTSYLSSIGVGEEALERHGAWRYYLSRSGYSCDFHPRFNRKGTAICIDSMHTGLRQVYLVKTAPMLAAVGCLNACSDAMER